MTENEAIELHTVENMIRIKNIKGCMATDADADRKECNKNIEILTKVNEVLFEIQRYWAMGTVKQIQKIFADWREYRALGTAEKLREAMEKQRPKKPEYRYLKSLANCPTCGEPNLQRKDEYGKVVENYSHCPDCGQAIDWSAEECREAVERQKRKRTRYTKKQEVKK